MKIRQRFISNSSSSSFIIGFKHDIASADEMRAALFKNRISISERYPDINGHYRQHFTSAIAQTVYGDYIKKRPTKEEIDDELSHYSIDSDVYSWNGKKSSYKYSRETLMRNFGMFYLFNRRYWKFKQLIKQLVNSNDSRSADHEFAIYDEIHKFCIEQSKMRFKKILNMPYIMIGEYSAHDGDLGTFLEYGNAFRYIPHIHINKH